MSIQTPSLQQTERALLDSEIRLQQVLDNSSAIVFAKDRRGRYLFVNREFERVTGHSSGQMLGHTDDDVFPPELAARFRYNDLRVLQEVRSIEFEEAADFGNGTRTFISSKFPLLDSDGVAYAICGMATDITERKRLEDAFSAAALAVSQSEEETLYRQLARYLSAILGVDGAFIATTAPGDSCAMSMQAFHLDGEVREKFSYPLAGTPCATVVDSGFQLYPSRLGELFPLDEGFRKLALDCYAGQPLTDGRGLPVGLIAVVSRRPFQDPSLVEATLRIFAVRVNAELERTAAAAALRASEEQYRAVFNASADAMVLWDAQFRRVDVNPAFERMYGWTREEVVGHGVEFPEFTAEHVKSRQDIVRRALAGESCLAEHEIVARSGARLQAEVRAVPFRHAGEPHVLVIARDITERKKAEEALRASEEQYRAIFNASTDALILWDSKLQRVDVNKAYERTYGWSRDQVLGRGYDHPAYTRDYASPREELVQRALAGEACHAELESIRSDGEHILTEVHALPFRHRGEPHVLAIARDITERKRAEAARQELEARLRQAQKMEAIGQLTGGIAHDFNNLLTSIMGYVALARDRDSVLGDPRLNGYLAQAQHSCERARDLIQQMLMFSRGRRGSPRAVSLVSVVRDALPTLRAGLPDSLELGVDADESAAPVFVDPAQVEQVLLNLCINARDATGGVGRVRLGVRTLAARQLPCSSCRQRADGPLVELVVEDNGHGMSPEVVEKIFEPFFSTKETGKGSGMGLAMVHGIVHEHGGHVVVESSPGAGARFRIVWPAVTDALEVTRGETQTATRLRPPRPALEGSVLIVDDEESVGEFMRELLDTWGIRAAFVARPQEALESVTREPARYDAVITDQSMPRMTGLQLARALHEVRADLPVILYSGYTDGLGDREVEAADLHATLRKPVDPRALREALSTILES